MCSRTRAECVALRVIMPRSASITSPSTQTSMRFASVSASVSSPPARIVMPPRRLREQNSALVAELQAAPCRAQNLADLLVRTRVENRSDHRRRLLPNRRDRLLAHLVHQRRVQTTTTAILTSVKPPEKRGKLGSEQSVRPHNRPYAKERKRRRRRLKQRPQRRPRIL